MTNNQIASLLMMILGFMLVVLLVLVCIYVYIKLKSKQKNNSETDKGNITGKTKVQQMYNVQSIFNFMEFDKIEDNMIVQKNGKKFLMVIKCQGINYDLMSGVEKSSVEQGFIEFLNTLRNPIQIYVQTRTVDLTGSIQSYKQKVRELGDNLSRREFEYNQKVRSGQYENQELDGEKFEVVKARNLYEYGTDIVNNTERMSLNRNILTKQYYVILSYYPEEAANGVYAKEEISNIAFSELYTRAQSTIGLLAVCGINGKILDSNELADLLYTAYNRDEAEVYDLNKAISSGYDSLYTTSQDVLEKKMDELDKQIERDAIKKANEPIHNVKQESENERKLKEKQKEYSNIVDRMAKLFIDENAEKIGDEVAEKAKEKIENEKTLKTNSESKEVISNEQEKANNTRNPRKSA